MIFEHKGGVRCLKKKIFKFAAQKGFLIFYGQYAY